MHPHSRWWWTPERVTPANLKRRHEPARRCARVDDSFSRTGGFGRQIERERQCDCVDEVEVDAGTEAPISLPTSSTRLRKAFHFALPADSIAAWSFTPSRGMFTLRNGFAIERR